MATLLLDFGLFILIWMIQLVVYPSFTYFSKKDLLKWHSRYTSIIMVFVMPLMLGQLGLHLLGLYYDFSLWRVFTLTLIGLAWINTFLFSVPQHKKITLEIDVYKSVKKLNYLNWYRSALWSLVFIITLLKNVKIQELLY